MAVDICSVCRRSISTTNQGLVRCHGPRNARCPGSGCPPVDYSSESVSDDESSQTSNPDLDEDEELVISAAETASSFSSVPSTFFKRVRVLKRLPKGSRLKAAKKLASILDSVVLSNDETSWFRLKVSSSAFQEWSSSFTCILR